MKLDQSAVQALNLFASPTDAERSMSLYGLLSKTRTAAGARLLQQWLRQPLMDLDALVRYGNAQSDAMWSNAKRRGMALHGTARRSTPARTMHACPFVAHPFVAHALMRA
jgi:hypothetical protein